MQSEELLELTASERLSLEEEYEMQCESDVGRALFALISPLLQTAASCPATQRLVQP